MIFIGMQSINIQIDQGPQGNTASKKGYLKSKNEFSFCCQQFFKRKDTGKAKILQDSSLCPHKCSKLLTAWMQQKEMAIDKKLHLSYFPSEVVLTICHLIISCFFCYTAALVHHVNYIFLLRDKNHQLYYIFCC